MHRCVCLVKAHFMLWFLTLWGQFQNLTSGQGQVVTQKGHAAYVSTRLGETNTLVVVSCLYVDYVESYSQKRDGDPGWPQMTPKGLPNFFFAWIVNIIIFDHYLSVIGLICMKNNAFENSSIDL